MRRWSRSISGPLRTEEAVAIAGHLAGLPDTTRRQCIERAGGNPLFLEQLLRNVAGTAGDLPLSLRGLVVARVDRLGSADRAALHAAAVLGQRFDPAALLALVGNPAFDVASLLRAGLLRADGRELVFAHALIREAVLRSLLAEAHRALHVPPPSRSTAATRPARVASIGLRLARGRRCLSSRGRGSVATLPTR